MSLLTPDIGLLFWMLLSFGIVFFVAAKYGFPVIVKMVDERNAFINKSLEEAKQANKRLRGIKEEEERLLKETYNKRIFIIKEANEMRIKIINDAKEKANFESNRLMKNAKENIQKEKELAMQDIRQQIAALSIDIAERVLRKSLDNKHEQLNLINELIKELN
ncbi:MAG: F0F1 ATP synthase subunit B [Candidatus Azobacteroides pseudotrichonymphae]|jgi:F-type H+-transporting ATPase subunit b|uniref:ATP synthase subunit b n=1 Tax=Azobacteroides pseudotrichonymphae genomovar. CFP2 TaxID=511995 RepID=ATPF_AZOPC|nr:F0F1 ATP synthase subunit B [Candidatus Azobacteroides pseudotrichonymphae]B6YR08.1 RecName: Full=ATP synthase subunit b; AltName: Full=ATP synthase F(0) sector subunit b; AltName: Full=ATPase subunit I; AltName: Full=F-type ATPase subunit b; Short=F-ATPase subunit b [Candidatus Azobacteroides pseudotrichonymphae genomovar. CFP2]MDR0529970.1 F0F1 ATP synthase subunit B [Bacteroidales bacterium OttesenSCG-928-I14]BAG83630.1 F-type ATP synthase B subunit [Candidatus Azobacteroides pseudotrichon